jgi:hypothetical protein
MAQGIVLGLDAAFNNEQPGPALGELVPASSVDGGKQRHFKETILVGEPLEGPRGTGGIDRLTPTLRELGDPPEPDADGAIL